MKRPLISFLAIIIVYVIISGLNSCNESVKVPKSVQSNTGEMTIDSLMDLAEKSPDDIALLNSIADLALQNKDSGLAVHYLNQSLRVSPGQTEVVFVLAGILQSQNDSLWKKLTDQLIKSNDPIAGSRGYFLMGIELANKDKLKEAIASFNKSISLNYSFIDPYIEKSILLLEKNETEDASAVLYTALDLDRKSPDIHFLIGECWMKKKNPKNALPFYEEALRLDPDFVSAQKRIEEINP